MKLKLTLTLLALLVFPSLRVLAQSNVSVTPEEVTDDAAFAEYQLVTAGMTPPKATHSPDPPFPDLPPDAEPSGIVVMQIGVDAHGHVKPVRVLRSPGQAFEKSAVATVKTWRFKPAKQDGKPVPVQITVEMRFER